jgi:hypothetical protein
VPFKRFEVVQERRLQLFSLYRPKFACPSRRPCISKENAAAFCLDAQILGRVADIRAGDGSGRFNPGSREEVRSMKKYMAVYSCFGGSEICVFADTKEKARKMALEHFISKVEEELTVSEVKGRTERCDICQHTYTPSDVIERDGERLCVYCYDDKFGFQSLSPEDIPF